MEFLKLFNSHSDYNAYINSEDKILPNLSYCKDIGDVHLNQVETKLVCKYNITNTSSATTLRTVYENNILFKSMEIDGVLLDSLVTEYQFDTTGEHTVKYELYDETKVGNSTPLFYNITTLTSVSIPDSVTTIGNNVFQGCNGLTSITIPDNVTTIGQSAFQSCSGLTSVTIGNSVTSISGFAFKECTGLTSVTIPNGVTTIANDAFYGCRGLTSVIMGSGATTIGESAFYGCTGLTNMTIGNGVTTIGGWAFNGCTGLTSVTIPNSVTTINHHAFAGCSGLTSITSLVITAPTITSSTFQNVKTGGTLIVPSGSTGYDVWMGTGNYYLGKYNWTKVEQ